MNPRKYSFLLILSLCAVAVLAIAHHAEIQDDQRGLQIGRTASESIGFHGATPTDQRSGSVQAQVTDTIGTAVATTSATNSTPYGFTTQAQADALVTRLNQARADIIALTALVNELQAALAEKGLIKGSQ